MLATPNTNVAEQPPADFGQQIAVDYWRTTPHVWSSQGNGKPCGLCLSLNPVDTLGATLHLEREPYAQKPIITGVISDGSHGGYHFSASLSCGHGPVGFATTPAHAPQVGDSYDCWSCQRPVDERNYPVLPEDVHARIEAMLPKCPECGGPIDKIPFIKRTVHKYRGEVDWRTGEIMASSEEDDALDEVPDDVLGKLAVECANGHTWLETRLSYQYDYRRDEHFWRIAEPAEPTVEVSQP